MQANKIKKTNNTKDLAISDIVFSGQVKFKKLAKSTLIFTTAPAMVVFLFVINGYVDVFPGLFLFGCIFGLALLFTYPYIADLQQVTHYVADLTQNKNPKQPDLSFLNNVEELSLAITKLNNSWHERNEVLKALLLEDEILINSLPTILLMLDDEINFLQTNQAAKNIFGWNYTGMIDKILKDSSIQFACKETLETGIGKNLRYEINEPNFFFFNVRVEKFPINSPNKIALVIIMQNLTVERKTEKMLSDFVANASHEIKTPLASLSGFIETLMEVENDPDAQRNFLQIMKEQSDRMNKLINDLLTLSMVESGVGKEKFEKLDLRIILSEAVSSLSKLQQKRKVSIDTDVELNIPGIYGNHDEILRVFDNLMSNAIKYSPEGKNIIVKIFRTNNSKEKFIEFMDGQSLIGISVIDKGEGIAEADIPRLAERFFRVDKARSRKVGGTGLGLSIVKHIAENHDGILIIKSELGKGSNFSVYFPVIS